MLKDKVAAIYGAGGGITGTTINPTMGRRDD
jgi:hypothetical protein